MYTYHPNPIAFLPLCICLCIILFKRFTAVKSDLLRLRGPAPKSWIFGNMKELVLGEFGVNMFNWQKLYGPAVRLVGCFGERRLLLSDPRGLQAVLGDNYTFPRSAEHRELARILMGEGILWAEADDHKRHRTLMQPCFSLSQTKQLLPCFIEAGRTLARRWEETLLENAPNKVIDAVPWMHRSALDVIGTAAFNYPFESLINDKNEVAQSYHNLLDDSMTRTPLSIILDGFLRYIPPWILSSLDSLPSKAMKKIRRNRVLVDELAKERVEFGLNDMRKGLVGGKDVLTQIVKANNATEAKLAMSAREVYAQVSSIMLAGEETVADSVSWALYELARSPEHQQALRAEVMETLNAVRERGDQDIAYADLDKMPFTTAFMKEVLRFHPPLPMSQREAAKDIVIPLGQPATTDSGETIEELRLLKGDIVIINTAGYNRLESVWGPDAGEFKPSRWFEARKAEQAPYPGMYANLLTFLGGPRGCLGWRFAMMEFQVLLIEIVQRFHLALPKGVEIRREMALVTIPVVVGDKTKTARLPLEVTRLDG